MAELLKKAKPTKEEGAGRLLAEARKNNEKVEMSVFEQVTPIVILCILVLFPLVTFITLLCNRKKLEEKKFKKRYGNLY
jgi:L-lactate permease